ncbi:retroviral-like aspartic protease family protein [Sphingomonas sp. KR1UV-12]|uniref:Retroviral-like aspartic protease family protein n=1 Tax=Sphingomonas aurea TaxID=3063994 RepID=A0ABT9EJQ0_9SPHN|nr:retroviral-like aspartic protease family protein [Sphingomonas sp. KR1UV-12]MDP1027156.1 retroviral-like aspartic protease family protein [Sphingomonas sp. KR1UV-12]
MFALIAAIAASIAGPDPAAFPPVTAQPEPAATPTDEWQLRDTEIRMTVPVSIAGKGDWPFVIDTGAERTVVSRELATELALAPGRDVRVTTMAGTAPTATAQVPLLKVSRLAPAMIEAPVYARSDLGAQGMLGLDALQGHRVAIDFDRSRMTLTPSAGKRRVQSRDPDEIVVVARSLFGQLIVTDAHWRNKRIAVVIDTGSSVTIANTAFLKLLGRQSSIGRWDLLAADGMRVASDAYVVDQLKIGGLALSNVPLAVADVAPFERFGLANKPALLLGMQTLRSFRMVEIDFPNRAIRFTVPERRIRLG